jgi:hypothetical protein
MQLYDVDGGGIELCLQMSRVVFLNHLHARPTVLGEFQAA